MFTAGIAVWWLAGSWPVSHHTITQAIQRWGHWIVPAVYLLIGPYILPKPEP